MKKVCVIGGGISGLSFAKIAKEKFDVVVLEKQNNWGGIAKTLTISDITYHPIGGHCFNSKHQEVLDFVFNKVLEKHNWHVVKRDAVIKLKGNEVGYPIEYHIKDIYQFDKSLAFNITKDFFAAVDDGKYNNLEEWFKKKFGATLSKEYLIPYNRKIWNNEPNKMSHEWVIGKLPLPNKSSFFDSIMSEANDLMPHSSFYYPNSNNQNTFIDALAEDVSILCNYSVNKIEYESKNRKWVLNDDISCDYLVSTVPLNQICDLIEGVPKEILDIGKNLKYNSVSTMLWETAPTKRTWTYLPGTDSIFHRYIHIGNFFSPTKNFTISEAVGKRTKEEMIENGLKDPFLIKPLAYNVSEHAYVVFDQNYNSTVSSIKNYLHDIGIKTLGRFGEWEYYNMDICIKKALDLYKELE